MGSRGASLGIAKNGKPYGAEFKTIYQWGNIKFVAPTDQSSEGKERWLIEIVNELWYNSKNR